MNSLETVPILPISCASAAFATNFDFRKFTFEVPMTETPERKCPDCNEQMLPIYILDRSRVNDLQSVDSVLTYTSPNAKPGWLGNLKPEGVVSAVACSQCGRIVLYAKKA